MFSSFSAGSVVGGCRVTSRCILRSSTQQQQRLSSRFSGIVTKSKNNTWKNSNNNIVNKKKHYFSTTGGKETAKAGETAAAAANNAGKETVTKTSSSGGGGKGYWKSAEFWGAAGAMAAWGMSGAAIYDSVLQGPEVISLTMTPVLIVYSGLFARWAWVVKPRNLSLMWCHVANVIAQTNQIRRALEYKVENGEQEQVNELLKKVGVAGGITAAAIVGGPAARSAISEANLGFVSNIAAADAGPFTVHFWAPMSKVFISGASMLDLNRPTDTISLPQYAALTLTGFFFTRYALLVTPINYTLCGVNVALFLSSFWHFGRKIKADYIDDKNE